MRQLFFILITLFVFSGCVNSYTDSYKIKYLHSTSKTDFTLVTKSLLNQLCPTLKKLDKSEPLTIIDFTNIKELENHSELGFVLSEELKTQTTQKCNWTINQIEFMRYLKVGANGTKLLSRDFNDIKYEKIKDSGYALIGTYAITQRQLIVYLKLVDLKDGVILHSATKSTTLTDEIIWLEKKDNKKSTEPVIHTPMVL